MHNQVQGRCENKCTMGALFQVSVDPSLEPGDLKGNIATVPAMLHQELLRK